MSQIVKRSIHSVLVSRGCPPRTSGILCFEDRGFGGHFVWKSIITELSRSAITSQAVVIVSLDLPISFLDGIFASTGVTFKVLDLQSDPEGWLKTSQRTQLVEFDFLEEMLLSNLVDNKSVILIDAITPLIMRLSFQKVLGLINRLRRNSNCSSIFIGIHADAHSDLEIKAFESLCTGILRTETPKEILLPLSSRKPHGALHSLQLTETGRVECGIEWYAMDSAGDVHFFNPPDDSQLNSANLVEAQAPNTTKQTTHNWPQFETSLMQQMIGGMKLTMTEKERNAKEEVILPYEKTLPNPQFGEIHYDRDSEEDLDSDEDPDDDLDL